MGAGRFGVALALAETGLSLAAHSAGLPVTLVDVGVVSDVQTVAACLVFGSIGALIAARHPRNPIDWVFCRRPPC